MTMIAENSSDVLMDLVSVKPRFTLAHLLSYYVQLIYEGEAKIAWSIEALS